MSGPSVGFCGAWPIDAFPEDGKPFPKNEVHFCAKRSSTSLKKSPSVSNALLSYVFRKSVILSRG